VLGYLDQRVIANGGPFAQLLGGIVDFLENYVPLESALSCKRRKKRSPLGFCGGPPAHELPRSSKMSRGQHPDFASALDLDASRGESIRALLPATVRGPSWKRFEDF
jgi:hypothetical protein